MIKLSILNERTHESIDIPLEVFNFPVGESHVKFEGRYCKFGTKASHIRIDMHYQSNDDIINLLTLTDLVRYKYGNDSIIELVMPYVPFSRQDRYTSSNECFSLKTFADLINSKNYDVVHTTDNHSDVSTALINNCKNVEGHHYLPSLVSNETLSEGIIVAPDVGATKKIEKLCRVARKLEYVQGFKNRNILTGELSSFSLGPNSHILKDKTAIIFDDICDGGGTFIGLAAELKKAGASRVELCVTHGFFTKGKEHLLTNGIDSVNAYIDFTTLED